MEYLKQHSSIKDFKFLKLNEYNNDSNYLGIGAYGKVKLAESVHTKDKYAIKIISKISMSNYNTEENIKNECNFLLNLKNPFIIKLYNYFEDEKNIYLVFEYIEKGNLYSYLKNKKSLKEGEAMFFIIQLLIAINYIHKYNIIHRDIKPENILINNKGNIKLIDFGWSALKNENGTRNTVCGSINYMAPEILNSEDYDESVDLWSIGVLLYELTQGYTPFYGKTRDEKSKNILGKNILKMENKISSGCINLINNLMNYDSKKRIKINQIENLNYIKQFCKKYNINIHKYLNIGINLSTLSSLNNENSFSKFSFNSKSKNDDLDLSQNDSKSFLIKKRESQFDDVNDLMDEFINPDNLDWEKNNFKKNEKKISSVKNDLKNSQILLSSNVVNINNLNINFDNNKLLTKEQENEINKIKKKFNNYNKKNKEKKNIKKSGIVEQQKSNLNGIWNSFLSNIGCISKR